MNENKKDNKKGNKNGKYDKNEFKRDVIERIREMFICGIETATQEQIYRAVCFVAMELISENWLGTKNAVRQYNTKTVYYLWAAISSIWEPGAKSVKLLKSWGWT